MVSLPTSYMDRHRWDGFLARSYIDRNCDAFYVIKLYIGRHLDCVFTMQKHHPSSYAHASNYTYTGMGCGVISLLRGVHAVRHRLLNAGYHMRYAMPI
jgi:hypothetical protein